MSKSLDTRDMDKKEKETIRKTLREASNDMNVIAQYVKNNEHKPASIAFKGMTRDKAERVLDKLADRGGHAYSLFRAGQAIFEKNTDKLATLAADALGVNPDTISMDQMNLVRKVFKFASDKNLVHFDHRATNLFMHTDAFNNFVLSDTMASLPSSGDDVASVGQTVSDILLMGAGTYKAVNGVHKMIKTDGEEGVGKVIEGTADISVGLATNVVTAKAVFAGAATGFAVGGPFAPVTAVVGAITAGVGTKLGCSAAWSSFKKWLKE